MNDDVFKSFQNVKNKRKPTRVATEGCNPEIFNECAYFPPVKNRYSFGKSPILDKLPTLAR